MGKPRRSARRSGPAGGIARATGRWRAIAARDGQETSAGIVRWGVAGSRKRSKGIRGWVRRQQDDLIRDLLIGFVVLAIGFGAAALWDSRLAERQNQLTQDLAEGQNQLTQDLAKASEIQENVRFVRQVVIDNRAPKPFRGLNLRRATLSGLDLACENHKAVPSTSCADLEGADLIGADLFSTDLFGADLIAAKLAFAVLAHADLEGAGLSLADLTGADLEYADLKGAFLEGANLDDALLTWADLTGAHLKGAHLKGANLSGPDLSGEGLGGADLTGADLTLADLTLADLEEADLTGVCYDQTTTWPEGFTPPPPTCP